jgi:repressor LexA
MLTRKQHDLLCFIHDRLAETGISPSFEEMKDALELASKSGVHRLISALEERGFIRRLANRARALEVVKMPERAGNPQTSIGSNVINLQPTAKVGTPAPQAANDVLEIPLHGRIAAGMPIEALEGQSSLAVPAALLGSGEHYALEVSGDSMVEAGILDGDYALVRKTESARNGEIVVALVDENEATLKYFRNEGSMIRLDPANRAYEPQRYDPNQIRIQGTLAGLLRRY